MNDSSDSACANCGTPLAGPFCHRCGQRERDPASISLREWIAQWADASFSLDGRLWRTLGVLLRSPGRLTQEYLAGHRVRWLPPLRLFLVSALFFVVVGTTAGVAPVTIRADDEARALTDRERREALEAAEGQMPELFRRLILADPQQINRAVLSQTAKAAVLLAPLFALVLRLLYWRRSPLYVPHLVFSLHLHSFAFLVGGVAAGADALLFRGELKLLTLLALAVVAAYLWRAQRRVYAAGRFAATWRTAVLAAVELIAILVLGLALLLVVLWL